MKIMKPSTEKKRPSDVCFELFHAYSAASAAANEASTAFLLASESALDVHYNKDSSIYKRELKIAILKASAKATLSDHLAVKAGKLVKDTSCTAS